MRFILGIVLAGVAFFMWGFLYWTLSPLPNMVINANAADLPALGVTFEKSLVNSGVYKYPPAPADKEAEEAFNDQMKVGPLYMVFYRNGGADMPTQMMYGGLHSIGLAMIGALIIMAASPKTYINRVMLIFWVAVFGTFWSEFGNVIWWNHPMNFCWLEMGYHIGGGLILGIILAAFIRPDPEMG